MADAGALRSGQGLRILRILTRFNVGGPARQALALQASMAELGPETVLVGGAVQDGEADLAELLGERNVIRIPELGRRLSPLDDLRATRSIGSLISSVRPHVVHTHMAKAGAIGRLSSTLHRVPVRIHTFHGHTLHGYFGPARTQAVVLAERTLARWSSALVAVSGQVKDDLLARDVGRPGQYRVLDAGIDLGPFLDVDRSTRHLRRSLGIGESARVIGFVGRLVPVKGVDVFLSAIEPVLTRWPDVHVLVAGDGPEMARVREASIRIPGGDRIHALGWVADMPRFYASLDVVVLASRNEGTPIALIEAAAAGVPAVSTRVGGVPEVIRDEVNGLLVPSGSAGELGAAIQRLLGDPALAARLSGQARRQAPRFAAGNLAKALLSLYLELLDRVPPGTSTPLAVSQRESQASGPS